MHSSRTWSSILTHSLARTFLGKALHHLSLQFVNTLNLLLSQELRILLVVFLTDVENLLAHLETLLDFLCGLSIRFSFRPSCDEGEDLKPKPLSDNQYRSR